LRSAESRRALAGYVPLASLAALAAGAAISVVPGLVLQLAIVGGTLMSTASLVFARAGRLLNPAWVIVALLYLIGPLGGLFSQSETDGSALGVLLLALTPFVAAATIVKPRNATRLFVLIPLGLLLLLAVASLAWSPSASYGSSKLTLWVVTGLIPAAFIIILSGGSTRVAWGLIALAAFATAVASFLFPDSGYPPTLFDSNPIWASRAAFIGALVALFGPFPVAVKLLATPVMIAGGLISLSLGPLVGLAAGAVAGVAEALRDGRQTERRVAVGWASLLVVTGVALLSLLAGLADPLFEEVFNDPNVSGRAGYLRALGPLFVDAPLFGIGLGGFASTGLADYPHNLVAEVALELGFAGLLLLLAWFTLALRAAAGSPLLVALVVATGVFSLFSGYLGAHTEFWLFTALALAVSRIGRNEVPVPSSSPP